MILKHLKNIVFLKIAAKICLYPKISSKLLKYAVSVRFNPMQSLEKIE